MIVYEDLSKLNAEYVPKGMSSVEASYLSEPLILGPSVKKFEDRFAAHLSVGIQENVYAVSVGSGYDALFLIFRYLREQQKKRTVFLQSNSYLATVMAALNAGLVVKFFEINENSKQPCLNGVEGVTDKNSVICITHMHGRFGEVQEITDYCDSKGIVLVEDAAQSLGAMIQGRHLGTFGHFSAFSFFPTKPLGGLGDGGAIICRSSEDAAHFSKMRFYGFGIKNFAEVMGVNSRLDNLNAAFLIQKLRALSKIEKKKNKLAAIYRRMLNKEILPPPALQNQIFSNHIFPVYVKKRNYVRRRLLDSGIQTQVHYPIPAYRQPAIKGRIEKFRSRATDIDSLMQLSLPISPILSPKQIEFVAEQVLLCLSQS
jgi:dTDP-4-amino-4,6-dideoxygalactose transaminase